MLRILYVLASLDSGGVGKLISDYALRFSDSVVCDFVVSDAKIGFYENLLKEKGFNIYHISQIRESLFKHNKDIKRIIKNGKYDVVHDNCDYRSYWTMKFAKKYKCPLRIVHIHSAFLTNNKLLLPFVRLLMKLSIKKSTNVFACGNKAFETMVGKSKKINKETFIIPNAIDLSKYHFSNDKRNDIRRSLNIGSNDLVIGTVSRFTYAKNHKFVLDLFFDLAKKDSCCKLLLVGDGELFDDMVEYSNKTEFRDRIVFLGKRLDVPDLLNVFDVFLLPSNFEGLPVSLIEAQANGLPAIISTNVTNEISFSNMIAQLPIDNGTGEWVNILLSKQLKRYEVPSELLKYDINYAARDLEKLYARLVSKRTK